MFLFNDQEMPYIVTVTQPREHFGQPKGKIDLCFVCLQEIRSSVGCHNTSLGVTQSSQMHTAGWKTPTIFLLTNTSQMRRLTRKKLKGMQNYLIINGYRSLCWDRWAFVFLYVRFVWHKRVHHWRISVPYTPSVSTILVSFWSDTTVLNGSWHHQSVDAWCERTLRGGRVTLPLSTNFFSISMHIFQNKYVCFTGDKSWVRHCQHILSKILCAYRPIILHNSTFTF